jgi:hypothetical protein
VKWIFNNDVFDHYDWTVEPFESLDELYNQRAKNIREKYDYVMLSYSGGADSHNVYEAFRRQDLLIDEIIVNNMHNASKNFIHHDPKNFTNVNAPETEYFLNTLPKLKEIQNQMPKTKISVFDMSDHIFNYLGNADEDWIINQREVLNPVGLTRFDYLAFSSVKKTLDKGKKIALITGVDKPKTFIRNGELFIRFVDRGANINSAADHHKSYENCTIEHFYWAPESTKILCKQGHTIKKFLETNLNYQEEWMDNKIDHRIVRLKHERILRSVLYSTWDDSWYQADKSILNWHNEFDNWFYTYYRDSTAYVNWQRGLNFVKDNLTAFLTFTPKGKPDGLLPIAFSYSLGPIKLKENLRGWVDYRR